MSARRVAAVVGLLACSAASAAPWRNYGRDAQHAGRAPRAAQPLEEIHWQAPVDLAPQYSGDDLLIHYGTPLVTARNTVVFPVKTGATDGFRVDARDGRTGAPKWTFDTDYVLPPHGWTPSCGACLAAGDRVVVPAAGGTLLVRRRPDAAHPDASDLVRLAIVGLDAYQADKALFDAHVWVSSPVVSDPAGNLFFSILADGGAPGLTSSGFARISTRGVPSFLATTDAADDATMTRPAMNAAPALSPDGRTLYVVARDGGGTGALCSVDARTMTRKSSTRLKDVLAPNDDASIFDDSTASPMVGPDGDVYFGVLEGGNVGHRFHGWLLHFDRTLSTSKTPGAFGWDDTASVVPRSAVPSYRGASKYLLLTKYNDYVQTGGAGINRLAVLDPNDVQTDPIGGATVMKEVLTIAAPTPDDDFRPAFPDAVREWCINTAAIDVKGRCALVNNEDGALYRWDFRDNTLSQKVALTSGIGEAYTPTVVGPDGTVYAINDATLFAVGRTIAK
jgi:hypothetical protein